MDTMNKTTTIRTKDEIKPTRIQAYKDPELAHIFYVVESNGEYSKNINVEIKTRNNSAKVSIHDKITFIYTDTERIAVNNFTGEVIRTPSNGLY